jgi:hypothetical protein
MKSTETPNDLAMDSSVTERYDSRSCEYASTRIRLADVEHSVRRQKRVLLHDIFDVHCNKRRTKLDVQYTRVMRTAV